jgi:hypothetical protein
LELFLVVKKGAKLTDSEVGIGFGAVESIVGFFGCRKVVSSHEHDRAFRDNDGGD